MMNNRIKERPSSFFQDYENMDNGDVDDTNAINNEEINDPLQSELSLPLMSKMSPTMDSNKMASLAQSQDANRVAGEVESADVDEPVEEDATSDLLNKLKQKEDEEVAAMPDVAKTKFDSRSKLLDEYRKLNQRSSLEAAQQAQTNGEIGAGITEGADTILRSVASKYGGKLDKGGTSEMLRKLGALPMQQIKEGNETVGKQLDVMNESEINDPESDVSKFSRQQAYAVLQRLDPDNKMGLSGKLEGMSAKQLQKLPGMKNLLGNVGAKANTRYVTIQEPNGKVVSKLIDMNTGETLKDLGMAGYAPWSGIDPTSGRVITKSRGDVTSPAIPVNIAGQGSTVPTNPGTGKKAPENVGDYRAAGIISPKEWDGNITKDKEGFEQANSDKNKIISSLSGIQTLAMEATKNSQTAASLGGIVGGLFEPGKLTDEDAKRYVRRLGLSNEFKDFMSQKIKGTITPSLANEIVQTAKVYKTELDKIARNNAVRYAKQTQTSLVNGREVDPNVLADFYYQRQVPDAGSPKAAGKVRVKMADGKRYDIDQNKIDMFKKDHPDAEIVK